MAMFCKNGLIDPGGDWGGGLFYSDSDNDNYDDRWNAFALLRMNTVSDEY